MSRFNPTSKGTNKTTNLAGGEAYKIGPSLNLYARVCASSLQDKFYESANASIREIRSLIAQCDPVFVAKLAIYAREKMNLRSIPLVLAVELAKIHKGDDIVQRMVERVIQRPDEITEILAYNVAANKMNREKKLNKISHQLRKGIGASFNKFSEYSFAKYNATGKQFSLKDAIMISHPKPKTKKTEKLIKKILDDNLKVPKTWEVELSEAGKTGKSQKEVWEDLIKNDELGYMALIRNLRNYLKAGVSKECIQMVCNKIANPEEVRKSKQLPFRFLSAYRAIAQTHHRHLRSRIQTEKIVSPFIPMILDAIEKAIKISVENIPMFENETVLIASDVSGSMIKSVSEKSSVMLFDISLLLGMLLKDRCKMSVNGMFGDTWKPYNIPSGDVIANVNHFYDREGEVGYSTNGYKVIQWANQQNYAFDRICIFTDCQLYGGSIQSEWSKYKQKNPNAKLYLFDLAGHGTSPLSLQGNGVHLISGWSDKIFEVMFSIENGLKTLDTIINIDF